MAQVAETLEEALDIAERAVTREDVICITGSFYLVGNAKKLVARALQEQARSHPLKNFTRRCEEQTTGSSGALCYW